MNFNKWLSKRNKNIYENYQPQGWVKKRPDKVIYAIPYKTALAMAKEGKLSNPFNKRLRPLAVIGDAIYLPSLESKKQKVDKMDQVITASEGDWWPQNAVKFFQNNKLISSNPYGWSVYRPMGRAFARLVKPEDGSGTVFVWGAQHKYNPGDYLLADKEWHEPISAINGNAELAKQIGVRRIDPNSFAKTWQFE